MRAAALPLTVPGNADDGLEVYGITFDAFCKKLGLNPICTDDCELVLTAQDLKRMRNIIWQDAAENVEPRTDSGAAIAALPES